MYRNENEFVRGQKIKIILAIVFYAIAVIYSGRWLP